MVQIAGSNFRVTCTDGTTCTTDFPTQTLSGAAFTAWSAAVHDGLLFQDGPNGSEVQDNDFFMVDSAQTILRAQGHHAVGFDVSADDLLIAGYMKPGQSMCFGGAADCLSYSTGLNSWLWSPSTNPGAYVAKLDTSGNAFFAGGIVASQYSVGATAGATCSGPPSAAFAVTNGIVTHC